MLLISSATAGCNQQKQMDPTDHIASLCARCDIASASASASLAKLAAQTGPRNRAKWKREHVIRVGLLERAAYALALALWIQPHAEDPLPASFRQYASSIHAHAVNHLKLLNSERQA